MSEDKFPLGMVTHCLLSSDRVGGPHSYIVVVSSLYCVYVGIRPLIMDTTSSKVETLRDNLTK